jgi:molybdopterin synthase sulfur carrier subunit
MRLLFLGKLRDVAGVPEMDLTVERPLDWSGLLAHLEPTLASAVADPAVHVACNGELLRDRERLSAGAGDEVAFLPPVSGG